MFLLHIVLSLLKIIGIILLVILGLILTLVLCVLFVPIRYHVHVTYNKELKFSVKVSYLLHIISIQYQKGDEPNKKIKIFGIDLHWFDEKRKEKRKEKKNERKQLEENAEFLEQFSKEMVESREEREEAFSVEDFPVIDRVTKEQDDVEDEFVLIDVEENKSELLKMGVENTENVPNSEYGEQEDLLEKVDAEERESAFDKLKSKIQAICSKIKNKFIGLISKIKYIFRKICGTIRSIRKKLHELSEMLHDEDFWIALRAVWNEVKNLIKHILPRKVKGHWYFGFENPATTGKLLGAICMFYGNIPKKMDIRADFENPVMDCDVQVKGHLQLYYVGWILIKLYRNKSVKKYIKKFRDS